jgi:hypothetical protein
MISMMMEITIKIMNNIDNATKFFTDFGIDKENLSVFNYNTSEGY